MAAPTREQILAALRRVVDPSNDRDVVSLGLVRNVAIDGGVVKVVYQVRSDLATEQLERAIREQTRAAILRLGGVEDVEAEFSILPVRQTNTLPGVKRVIAVGAGKGGVGKSTVSLLTAVGMMRRGLKAGLLDADVYGPSLPKMTGTEDAQPMADMQGYIIPPERDGLPIMSMGYLVPANEAVVWRGPMAQKYVKEFLDRGKWNDLDYLIVDLPPGTGDIPLTLAQSIPLTGAVVVCTPQDVALLDAIKAYRMYEKLGVQPLGFVENMSFYCCPQCGHRDDIFGHGGTARAAETFGVPLLGEIPLNTRMRMFGDLGNVRGYYEDNDPLIVDALDKYIDKLIEVCEAKSRTSMPLPQLKIT